MRAAYIFLLSLGVLTSHLSGQSPERHPGVVLFEQAKFSEAIRSLEIASRSKEYKADAELWNYLGLAYLAKDETKKSRKAFERSVELNPANPVFHANLAYAYLRNRQGEKAYQSADRAIKLDPKNAGAYSARGVAGLWANKLDPAERDADMFIVLDPGNAEGYLLKSEILIAKLTVLLASGRTPREEVDFLKRALDTLEQGVVKSKGSPRFAELEKERESIAAFHEHYSRDLTRITSSTSPPPPEPGVKPYRILYKPPARYTDAARTAGVEGTVRMAVLLGASGKVEHLLLLARLGHGLDQEAIKAAREIKFEPKMKDGKPVSTIVVIEYGFDIY